MDGRVWGGEKGKVRKMLEIKPLDQHRY